MCAEVIGSGNKKKYQNIFFLEFHVKHCQQAYDNKIWQNWQHNSILLISGTVNQTAHLERQEEMSSNR